MRGSVFLQLKPKEAGKAPEVEFSRVFESWQRALQGGKRDDLKKLSGHAGQPSRIYVLPPTLSISVVRIFPFRQVASRERSAAWRRLFNPCRQV